MVGRLAAALGTLAVLLLLVAACGGSGGSGPSHDSPEGAVRGLIATLEKNDLDGAKEWILPSERAQFSTSLDEARAAGLKIDFKVESFEVTGSEVDKKNSDKATVKTKGKAAACVAGSIGGQALSTCSPVQSNSGSGNDFVCVRESGKWYVSINQSASGMRSRSGSAAAA